MKSIRVLVALTIAATALAVNAQPVPTVDAAIPPANCEKPVGGPGIQPSYDQQQRFQKKVDTYKDCINRYVGEMKKQSDQHFELVKKYQDAGNAAINDYNAYVNELNTQYGKKDGADAKPAMPASGARPSSKY